ncbi:hypothetical protein Q2T42_10545 [Leptolyngbya boryana CZ1]|uniref:Uncharacterized protein n=1 Tax=Leptolyngbya boryana CZ1 TaxID=3060204 RepID=A0AA96WZE0_LEPBY|nr:hypothetical protein [Leptolyngbya boryana]WNZ48267.1 hypothetical protein Q2T42_10545 [Leptolyngbya boryana CZ1]
MVSWLFFQVGIAAATDQLGASSRLTGLAILGSIAAHSAQT